MPLVIWRKKCYPLWHDYLHFYLDIVMKSLTVLSVALLTLASQHSFAHAPAPQLRGELTTITPPQGFDLAQMPIAGLPTPKASVSNVVSLPSVLIPANTTATSILDVTLIDDLIADISPNARHYPPNFPNRTSLYYARENIKYLSDWLEPYATAPNASFDVLLRATKINSMARNLDLGHEYGLRASAHVANALKLQPTHAEANFLYGMMLSEGGGFKEGKKYLDRAIAQGYLEAEQTIAQAELLGDNRSGALARLQKLQALHPNNTQLAKQIDIINSGGFYIWDIKDTDVNIKPLALGR